MKEYDVIVAGAGPAGSRAAYDLSKKGLEVLLISRNKYDSLDFKKSKACGGIVPKSFIKEFPEYEQFVENPVSRYRIISPNGEHVSMYPRDINDKGEIHSYLVRRAVFDKGLYELAIKAGAKSLIGKIVKDVKFLEDCVIVNNEYMGKVFVDAMGVESKITKYEDEEEWNDNLAYSIVIEKKVEKEILNDFFTNERSSNYNLGFKGSQGYGWVFSLKNHINVGVGVMENQMKPKQVLQLMKDYVNYLIKNEFIPEIEIDYKTEANASRLPLGGLVKKVSDRLVPVGDAKGLVMPMSGEGIRFAVKSGMYAAQVIKQAFIKNDFSKEFLSKYDKLCKKNMPNFRSGVKLRNIVFKFSNPLVYVASKSKKIMKLLSKVSSK